MKPNFLPMKRPVPTLGHPPLVALRRNISPLQAPARQILSRTPEATLYAPASAAPPAVGDGCAVFLFAGDCISRRRASRRVSMQYVRRHAASTDQVGFTDPSLSTQFMATGVTNFTSGGSSGYCSPQVMRREYIRLSKAVSIGPKIVAFHSVRLISSSLANPQEMVAARSAF